jgi:hypothetical protein
MEHILQSQKKLTEMKKPTGIDVGGYGIQAGFHVIAGIYIVQ